MLGSGSRSACNAGAVAALQRLSWNLIAAPGLCCCWVGCCSLPGSHNSRAPPAAASPCVLHCLPAVLVPLPSVFPALLWLGFWQKWLKIKIKKEEVEELWKLSLVPAGSSMTLGGGRRKFPVTFLLAF